MMKMEQRKRSVANALQTKVLEKPFDGKHNMAGDAVVKLENLSPKDLKLLEVLASKKEEEAAQKQIAAKYRQLWEIEGKFRRKELTSAEIQYRNLLDKKREAESKMLVRKRQERERSEFFNQQMHEIKIMKKHQLNACRRKELEQNKQKKLLEMSITRCLKMAMAEWRRVNHSKAKLAQLLINAKGRWARQHQASLMREKNLSECAKRTKIRNQLSQKEWEEQKKLADMKTKQKQIKTLKHISQSDSKTQKLLKEKSMQNDKKRKNADLGAFLRKAILSIDKEV